MQQYAWLAAVSALAVSSNLLGEKLSNGLYIMCAPAQLSVLDATRVHGVCDDRRNLSLYPYAWLNFDRSGCMHRVSSG